MFTDTPERCWLTPQRIGPATALADLRSSRDLQRDIPGMEAHLDQHWQPGGKTGALSDPEPYGHGADPGPDVPWLTHASCAGAPITGGTVGAILAPISIALPRDACTPAGPTG